MSTENPEDRGDDFTPTEEDVAAEATRVAAEAAENARIAKGEAKKDDTELSDEEVKKAEAEAAKAIEDAKKATEAKPEPGIPLSRHKEILNREREARAAAERRLAEAATTGNKSQLQADIEKDELKVEELETRYAKSLADGELAESQKLQKEIRLLERSIMARQYDEKIARVTAETAESMRYENTVAALEAVYPELEYGNDQYSQAKVDEVLLLKVALEAQRFTPSAALQKAVAYVFPPKTEAQERAVVEDVKEGEENLTPDEVKAKRKAEAVAKSLATQGKQPPNLKDAGIDSDKAGGGTRKSVLKMSTADFDKLGEEELAAMRGDDL